LRQLERIFKALGQGTRLKIVYLLNEQELCVCELEQILEISQSAISQHMRTLKEADLVQEERRGQWVFYSLNRQVFQERLQSALSLLESGLAGAEVITDEFQRLRKIINNPIVSCRIDLLKD